ncbi:PGF-CTERM sorting domain-containing protein [Halogeometricum borinquense]|uniref:PGF-CTERM sorting domain-containing protein n=1 Tax=Halogeometricum borinquense TaxID=60847 RepID=A0A6C0UJW9_9EURY|nr:PGF-CTERM sorting domain-containing protein [Halogeometricum borinquense]QIB75824.1 PGF-CTERM sorting domain-containing protein [Halogeometricum borinquense]QIQ75593.1 PGF-CTERM sorting domain-containing protein [Halogeometricum borinquense]
MQRALTLFVTLVVLVGTAPAGAAATPAAQQSSEASVSFAAQSSGGSTVVVENVTLPDGGFVTIHDASVADGNVLGSVVGSSAYLDAGTHENVTVHLDEPLSESGAFVAMPHRDTDGDRVYDFVADNGETDGPYTADGSAVISQANVTVSATVSMSDQPTDGTSVVVDRVELSDGGFVTVHDASVTEGEVFESIRGTSAYLEAGVHENVRITLDAPVEENTTLVPMAHMDTDDNQEYTFPESEGEADGPYTADGSAVVDTAAVTLSETANVTFSAQSSGGQSVVVDSAYLPEGGFVTVHDATLNDGAVFESIRGTSAYLAPGLHKNVRVSLDAPLNNSTTLVPMAHMDTDDNQEYTFPESEGEADGPYTADGGAVVAQANVTLSASVDMSMQASDGHSVVVDRVELSEGGFVVVHDASLFAGEVEGSILGTSDYLEPGVHENVTVTFAEPIRASQTLVPMAHMDTNGNEAYDFPEADGPYTAGGNAVVDTARTSVNAVVTAADQTTDGQTVTIDSVTLHDGGFVTVHDATVTEGAVFESVRGTSAYLSPGTHENVSVELSKPLTETTTIVPMAHMDTNGNEAYDFVTSDGTEDGPYVALGGAVVATAEASVEDGEMTETEMTETEMADGETEVETGTEMNEATDGTDTGTPGFGVVVAIIALVAAALIAVRRD